MSFECVAAIDGRPSVAHHDTSRSTELKPAPQSRIHPATAHPCYRWLDRRQTGQGSLAGAIAEGAGAKMVRAAQRSVLNCDGKWA